MLASRGWNSFGTYDSGGTTLFVSREPIGSKSVFDRPKQYRGTGNLKFPKDLAIHRDDLVLPK